MKRFGQASRQMDWVGIILLSMMMAMLWLNSALAADGKSLAQPDTAGALDEHDGCVGFVASAGVEWL
jgi:hypothetical protein